MNTIHPSIRRFGFAVLALLGLFATVSLNAKDKEPKGATTVVLEHPIAQVQKAAVNAMAVIGCKMRKDTPTYLEGKRSNKVGIAVGSGGETIKIWLTEDEPSKTTLKVATVKSLFGYVGQRSWNEAVLEEIKKELSGTAPDAPEQVTAKVQE